MRMALVAALLSGTPVQAGTTTLLLPQNATTSAGIFDAQDHLQRTLWSGKSMLAGRVTVDWDGRDDDGTPVPRAGQYRARLLAHNVRYIWEGVIGNTSKELTGAHIHRAYTPINDMAIDRMGHAFYVVGYNEQQSGIHRFDTSEPQVQTSLAHDDYRRKFSYVATDGALAYFANVGVAAPRGSFIREPTTFVIALRVTDDTEYHFPLGKTDMLDGRPGQLWNNVIDYDHDDVDVDGRFRASPSGLAVQQQGNALFVAHQGLGEVRVLDKRQGHLLDRIPALNPTGLAVAADDSLWVLCQSAGRAAAVHYQRQDGHWIAVGEISEGLNQPVAIGVSPVDGMLIIADAGSEQLKAFDARGNALWTYGQLNGYRDSPEVRTDRLWLSAGPTYIAFQSDGSFWVGDSGNARNLHLSAGREYLEQIMYLPASYHVAVDATDPIRVFNRFLEFSVDYSKPLRDSWRLVRNWGAALDKVYLGDLDGLRAVVTLSNSRTYGVVPRYDSTSHGSEIVELTARGLRSTGIRLQLGEKLYPDGSLRSQALHFPELQVLIRKLIGFDQSGNPKWGDATPLAGISMLEPNDPYYHEVPVVGGVNEAAFPETSSGVVVFFNPGLSEGFHLGGVRLGDSRWRWRASPSGSWDVDSRGQIVSLDGTYNTARGVQYAGNVVVSSGRHIVFGYHGEAWNNGEADQWMHYLDNGMFVGQFGRPVYAATNKINAQAESAGNAFSPQLITVDGRLYLWHNDEGVHGGVHRWRIDGIDHMLTLEAPIDP
jgi:hypothetical protein